MKIAENFIVDKLKPSDGNQLYQFMVDNNERLSKYFPVTLSSNSTLEKTVAYISIKEKEIQEKSNFTFAIREKNNQNIAGLIIIKKIDWTSKQGEFAYCIGSEYEGKGLTTFAVKEISNFAFNELELKTLQIISHKTNLGSIKVAENNGFIWKRTLINEFTPTNEEPLDMELYELKNEK
jgi:ribosomal-protein-alanine N-acetyltransferase